jgi:hypothetical protein
MSLYLAEILRMLAVSAFGSRSDTTIPNLCAFSCLKSGPGIWLTTVLVAMLMIRQCLQEIQSTEAGQAQNTCVNYALIHYNSQQCWLPCNHRTRQCLQEMQIAKAEPSAEQRRGGSAD